MPSKFSVWISYATSEVQKRKQTRTSRGLDRVSGPQCYHRCRCTVSSKRKDITAPTVQAGSANVARHRAAPIVTTCVQVGDLQSARYLSENIKSDPCATGLSFPSRRAPRDLRGPPIYAYNSRPSYGSQLERRSPKKNFASPRPEYASDAWLAELRSDATFKGDTHMVRVH